jgi:tetratricopeptide (TPR) repeat protein
MRRISVRLTLCSKLCAAALAACVLVPAPHTPGAPVAAPATTQAVDDIHSPLFWLQRARKDVTANPFVLPDDGEGAASAAEQMENYAQISVQYSRAGNNERAVDECRKSMICAKFVTEKSKAAYVFANLVEVLARADQMPQAAYSLDQCIKLADDNELVIQSAAESLLRAGKLEEALGTVTHQLKLPADRIRVETSVAIAYAKAGNRAKAEEAYKKAEADVVAADAAIQGEPVYRGRWAEQLVADGEWERAQAQAARLPPDYAAPLLATIAAAHQQAGAKQKYEQAADQAMEQLSKVEIEGVRDAACQQLAKALAAVGDANRMNRCLEKIPATKGLIDAHYHFALAIRKAAAADISGAKADLDKGLSLLTKKASEKYRMLRIIFVAEAMAKAGKYAEARELAAAVPPGTFIIPFDVQIAEFQAEAGQFAQAKAMLETISVQTMRRVGAFRMARAAGIANRDMPSVLKWIESMPSREDRHNCYLKVAEGMNDSRKK